MRTLYKQLWVSQIQSGAATTSLMIHQENGKHFLFPSVSRDFLTAEDKENIFNADHFPLWYRRAAEQIPGNFVYSIPFSTGSSFSYALIFRCSLFKKTSQLPQIGCSISLFIHQAIHMYKLQPIIYDLRCNPKRELGQHKALGLAQECHKHTMKCVWTTLREGGTPASLTPDLCQPPWLREWYMLYGVFAAPLDRHEWLVLT